MNTVELMERLRAESEAREKRLEKAEIIRKMKEKAYVTHDGNRLSVEGLSHRVRENAEAFSRELKKIREAKMLRESKDTPYFFRGEINLNHLVNDCLKDGKVGFVVVTPDKTYAGVLNINGINAFRSCIEKYPFWITEAPKEDTSDLIKIVRGFCKKYYKDRAKLARKIKSKTNSGQPESKVMVF